MSSSTVSALASQSALTFNAPRFDRVRGRDGTQDSDGGQGNGVTLFSALLQALVTAVQQSGSSTSAAASSATAVATTTSSAAASGSTPSASGTSSSNATATSHSTPSTSGSASTSTTPSDSLAQDLQSFLHDLFHALRGARHQEFERPEAEDRPASSTTASPAPSTTANAPASNSSASTTSNNASTSATSASGATGTTGGTNVASAGSATVNYGEQGLVIALKQLIQDLSNSAVPSTGSASSGVNAYLARSLNNLNTAFNKLIEDLRGAAGTSAAGASTGTATSSDANTTTQGNGNTAALQAFLKNFLQDLQSGASSTGQLINTTA